ncbi:hypothetical protein C2L71_02920 [Enteroscipio rubneri]|uniref:Uncharacterized protein n=1 Tax=Enteroscipio rubneri TaxID=2070686 RepID=A0A2K2UDB0_9ACTN|nr:hypothetical protein C2L71_02920 [Enteroscipio rubneri]
MRPCSQAQRFQSIPCGTIFNSILFDVLFGKMFHVKHSYGYFAIEKFMDHANLGRATAGFDTSCKTSDR